MKTTMLITWITLLFVATAFQSSAADRPALRKQVEGAIASVGVVAVPQLIAVLDSGGGEQRRSAARILSFLEDGNSATVRALTQALLSDDAVVRQFSALGLRRRAEFAGQAVPVLIRQAKQDPEQGARRHAILALGYIRQREEETIPALLAALQSDVPAIREAGLVALKQFISQSQSQSVITALRARLVDRDEVLTVRQLAIAALVRYGDPGLRELRQIIGNLPPELRAHFVQELGLIDGPSPTVEKELIASLKDEDPIVRRQAAISLGAISPRSPEALNALIEKLRDDRPDVRRAASRALRQMKGASQSHVITFLAETNDPGETLFAMQALRHDEVLVSLVEPMKTYLNSDNSEVRQAASEVLGYLAERSDQAFQGLRDATARDKRVSPDAISVLSKLKVRRAETEETLRGLLANGEVWWRAHILESLAAAGIPLTDPTKEVVIRLLNDSSPLVAEQAARLTVAPGVGWKEGAKVALEHGNAALQQTALDRLTDPALAESVAPNILQGWLQGQNARYSKLAARALGIRKESPSGVAGVLQQSFQSADPVLAEATLRAQIDRGLVRTGDVLELVRTSPQAAAAIRVLAGLDFDVEQTIAVLISKLQSEDNLEARLAASELLGRIGKPAVAALRELLRQNDQIVLELALNAVRLAGPAAADAVTDLIDLLKN